MLTNVYPWSTFVRVDFKRSNSIREYSNTVTGFEEGRISFVEWILLLNIRSRTIFESAVRNWLPSFMINLVMPYFFITISFFLSTKIYVMVSFSFLPTYIKLVIGNSVIQKALYSPSNLEIVFKTNVETLDLCNVM